MVKTLKGKIVYQGGELMIQHSPKKIFAQDRTGEFHKIFYEYSIINPFSKHDLKEGDNVNFVIETYIDNGGSFKFGEIVD